MLCITFIIALTSLPTSLALLLLFAIDGVTRNILIVRLLLPCRPVLLESFEVISGAIWCDGTRNKLWGGSATASLNIIFLWSVDFFLVKLALLTWGVDCLAVYLSFICLILAPVNFEVNRSLVDYLGGLALLNKSMIARKAIRSYLNLIRIMWKLG